MEQEILFNKIKSFDLLAKCAENSNINVKSTENWVIYLTGVTIVGKFSHSSYFHGGVDKSLPSHQTEKSFTLTVKPIVRILALLSVFSWW